MVIDISIKFQCYLDGVSCLASSSFAQKTGSLMDSVVCLPALCAGVPSMAMSALDIAEIFLPCLNNFYSIPDLHFNTKAIL